MNYIAIGFISVIVVGVMEVVKNFLPANTNKMITSGISLGLSIALPVCYGIVTKTSPVTVVVFTAGVVGLTQLSYNFVLKLLKALIEKLETKITKDLVEEKKEA